MKLAGLSVSPSAELRAARQRGFSTIEAMVAIAILGIALIPLYGFQNTIVSGTSRVEASLDRQATQRLVQTYLNGLHPQQLQTGEGRIGELQLDWTLQEVSPSRDVLSQEGLPGRFKTVLVRVDFQATNQESNILVSGSLDRVTWTETHSFLADLNR